MKKALGFRFSNQRVGKAKKATYFAQSYGVFATAALNAANVREQVRQKGGSLQDFGGEGATGTFTVGTTIALVSAAIPTLGAIQRPTLTKRGIIGLCATPCSFSTRYKTY